MEFRARHVFTVFFSAALLLDAWGNSELPFATERAQIDLLFARALNEGAGSGALKEIEKIIQSKDSDLFIKRYALDKVGDLKRSDGDQFLLHVSSQPHNYARNKGEIGIILDTARLAHLKSSVAQEKAPPRRRTLLTDALDTNSYFWAADELCSNGDVAALPQIKKVIMDRSSSERGLERITSCESKIRLLTKNPTRISALRAALADNNTEIKLWGIRELGKMNTSEAEAALVNFASSLRNNTSGSNWALNDAAVDSLKKRGWDDARFKKHGIRRRH